MSLGTPPVLDSARMEWLTAAISTASEMGSWCSPCTVLSSWHKGGTNGHKSHWERRALFTRPKQSETPPVPPDSYLCRGGGLQSVKAKRSAERSLVKIGQIAGLEARGATNKAAQTHPQRAKTHQKQHREFGSTCSEKSFPSMSSLLECPPGL